MENQPIYTTNGETEELIMDIFTDVLNRHGVTLSNIEYAKLECDVMDVLCGKYVKMDVTTDDLLGRTVNFGNHKWIVAHIEGEYTYLMLSEVLNPTVFGTDVKYENSELLKAAAAFISSLPADALDRCQYVTVNGVTSKVFVPSYEQLASEWDWPKTAAANRICQYGGSNTSWWTSSPSYSKYVWFVGNGGGFISSRTSGSFGFRPAIKVCNKDVDLAAKPYDANDEYVASPIGSTIAGIYNQLDRLTEQLQLDPDHIGHLAAELKRKEAESDD